MKEQDAEFARRSYRISLVKKFLWNAFCFALLNGVLLLLLRLVTHPKPIRMAWWTQMVVGVGILLSGLFLSIYQRRHWSNPIRRLTYLLPQVREGKAAIESLSEVGGGLKPLIVEIQETLHAFKRRQAEGTWEMRRKLSTKTDALEHSLGVMRHQASRDGLTGLLNRRALDETFPNVVERSQKADAPLAVMMIDVDNFKPLNDTLGHAVGDDLLRSLGQLFRSTIRENDLAFRYGGDEFVILMPELPIAPAKEMAQRLIALVDQMTKSFPVKNPPRLSIGVIAMSPNQSAAQLLREADRLLYAIKAARKRKVA